MMVICAHLCFECTGVVQVECEVHKKAMELCIGTGGAYSNSPEFEGIRMKPLKKMLSYNFQ